MFKGKKKNYVTRFFVPVLFKFKDDKVSIKGEFLDLVKEHICEDIIINGKEEKPVFTKLTKCNVKEINCAIDQGFTLTIRDNEFKSYIDNLDNYDHIYVYVYYYHHRLIFDYQIHHKNKLKKKLSSSLRDKLHNFSKRITDDFISVYEEIRTNESYKVMVDNKKLTVEKLQDDHFDGSKIISFYSYPVIIQEVEESYINKMSNRLETMFFKVFLPNRIPFSYGTVAFIRISIPGINLFHTNKLHSNIISDFINTVYEIGLYEKKINDKEEYKEKLKKNKDYSIEEHHKNTNRFDEIILKGMWQHFLDTLDGKIASHQQQKVAKISYIFGILGGILAILAIMLTVISMISGV